MDNPSLNIMSSAQVPPHIREMYSHAEASLEGLRGISHSTSFILDSTKRNASSMTVDECLSDLARSAMKARDGAVKGIALLASCLSDFALPGGIIKEFEGQFATCTHELVLNLARTEVKKFFDVVAWGADYDDVDDYISHCETSTREELAKHLAQQESLSASLSGTPIGIDLQTYRRFSTELRLEFLSVAKTQNPGLETGNGTVVRVDIQTSPSTFTDQTCDEPDEDEDEDEDEADWLDVAIEGLVVSRHGKVIDFGHKHLPLQLFNLLHKAGPEGIERSYLEKELFDEPRTPNALDQHKRVLNEVLIPFRLEVKSLGSKGIWCVSDF